MSEQPNSPNSDGWVSLTELAAIKNVGKAAMSERVKGLEQKGLINSRQGKGRVKLINLAEFDMATAGTTDLARLAAVETKRAAAAIDAPETAPPGSYTRAQALKMAMDADMARMKRDAMAGTLVAVQTIADAAKRIGEALTRSIDQLPSLADDLATVVAKDGAAGLRAALKQRAFEIRRQCADALDALAVAAQTETIAADEAAQETDAPAP